MNLVDGLELRDYLKDKGVLFQGDFNAGILGFCSIRHPKTRCIAWVKNPSIGILNEFEGCCDNIIVTTEAIDNPIRNCRYIITEHPKMIFFDILKHFWQKEKQAVIQGDSFIETSSIEQNVSIGHYCYINENVIVGEGTIIEHNVSIVCPTQIGKNCIIHSGVVIGTDGFGYYQSKHGAVKVEHYGGVIIGDNVEIGANTCIDRATIDNTIIGNNVKIDNLVHIGHNVIVEDNCMVVANAMLGGSSVIKEGSYIAPSASILNQIIINENAFVGTGAVVTKNVDADLVVAGVPAEKIRKVKLKDK